jgi:hypothetical protein
VLIELLYFDGCPNHGPFLDRLRDLLAEAGVPDPVRVRRVDDDEAARAEHFLGSPTLRVDGQDVDPMAVGRTGYGLQCRLYDTAEGLRGSPPDSWVLAAVRAASTGSAGES